MDKIIISAPLLCFCLFTSCGSFTDQSDKNKAEKVLTNTKPSNKDAKTQQATSVLNDNTDTGVNEKNPNNVRTIPGFIEPDVTQLPDNKVLQESNNVAPAPSPLTPTSDNNIVPLEINPTDSLPNNP